MLPKPTSDERRYRFFQSVDWLSVINNDCSFVDFISFLKKNTNINFSIRYIKNNQYIVISKDSYLEFFDFFETYPFMSRITRIDIKFDIEKDYIELYNDQKNQLIFSHGIVSKSTNNPQTIYFNSRQSDMFCRFYNKQVESNLKSPLSRVEYEIKGFICRQFSIRWSSISSDDAINYLYSLISEFNYRKGINGLISGFDYDEPYSIEYLDRIEKRDKFRRFLIQYRHSILEYCRFFGVDDNKFFDLCKDLSEFEKVVL